MNKLSWYQRLAGSYDLNPGDDSPDRYRILRRNIVVLMLLVTTIPLVIMAAINQY